MSVINVGSKPEPLFVIGSDHTEGGHDPGVFVGPLAERHVHYPEFDPATDPPPGVWITSLADALGYLIPALCRRPESICGIRW